MQYDKFFRKLANRGPLSTDLELLSMALDLGSGVSRANCRIWIRLAREVGAYFLGACGSAIGRCGSVEAFPNRTSFRSKSAIRKGSSTSALGVKQENNPKPALTPG